MNTTFASQMRNRRKVRRMSLRALRDVIGGVVSHEMLARYERGEVAPRADVAERLRAVLGILDDVALPMEPLQNIQFRARYELPKKEQDAIVAAATEHFNLYREVERRVGADTPFRNPFEGAAPDFSGDTDVMEDVADELRRRWNLGFGPLPNLCYLLERKGIKIFEVESGERKFSGFSAELGGCPLICVARWLNDTIYLPRKRMTLAHELAHILFPSLDAAEGSEEEYYIQHFAGALLMPRAALFEALGNGPRDSVQLGELLELKHYFGASLKAIMIRAWQLGIVSPDAQARWEAYYASHRYLDKDPGAYAVPEHSERYRQLVARGVLCGAISQEEAATRFQAPLSPEMSINVINPAPSGR